MDPISIVQNVVTIAWEIKNAIELSQEVDSKYTAFKSRIDRIVTLIQQSQSHSLNYDFLVQLKKLLVEVKDFVKTFSQKKSVFIKVFNASANDHEFSRLEISLDRAIADLTASNVAFIASKPAVVIES